MPEIRYLTVQDMIWINHLVTGKVLPFDFAKLEEGTYFQYGYGKSTDIPGQAAKFLEGFTRAAPFSEGNEATGFVGFVSFLRANGHELKMTDVEAAQCTSDAISAAILETGDDTHELSEIAAVVRGAANDYPKRLKLGVAT